MDNQRLTVPWRKHHIGDFRRITHGWPAAARAAYIDLADTQWDEGELPVEPAELRALVACTDAEWAVAWPRIDRTFPVVGNVRKNLALDAQRAEQIELHEKRSAGGRARAAQLWPATPLPAAVDQTAWDAYLEHRRAFNLKPLSRRGLEKLAADFAEWPPDVQIEAVDASIRNGWKGFFPHKVRKVRDAPIDADSSAIGEL